MDKKNFKSVSLLTITALVTALVLCEMFLRVFIEPNKSFYVWPPDTKKLFLPQKEYFTGISGPSWMKINSIGLRGDQMPLEAERYILVLGGSAAECIYLDQSETWPQLLQESLNKKNGTNNWVGNAGQSGRNIRHNLHQLKYLPQNYKKIDTVILMIGVNDLLLKLKSGEQYKPLKYGTQEFNRETFGYAFSQYPRSVRSEIYDSQNEFYKKSALWNLLSTFKERWLASENRASAIVIQDERGEGLKNARLRRANAAPFIDRLPNLSSSLQEYEDNILIAKQISQSLGIRLILLTQPAIWDSSEDKEKEALLWMGHAQNDKYYSARALDEGLSLFNNKLKETALKNNITVLDLAENTPKTSEVFYDDMHFNEQGAKLIAEQISQLLTN